jgi:hypothetical protein
VQAFLTSVPSLAESRDADGLNSRMPDRGLASHEIDALAAFLGR